MFDRENALKFTLVYGHSWSTPKTLTQKVKKVSHSFKELCKYTF